VSPLSHGAWGEAMWLVTARSTNLSVPSIKEDRAH